MRLVVKGRPFSRSSLIWCLAVSALVASPLALAVSVINPAPGVVLAANTGGSQGDTGQGDTGGTGQGSGQPLPGQLIVPGSPQQSSTDKKKGKQCMTTCAQWGEECILVNQGAGGMQRRCRHVCKQFTEECY